MTGYEEFTKLFGSMSVALLLELALSCAFIYFLWTRIKKKITERHDEDVQRDADIQEALEGARKYPEIESQLANITDRLDKIEDSRKERERRKLNNLLLQNYNMYADENKNPMKAWTEMEADAFWGLFDEYEKNDGDGFMHTEVQPKMKALRVIKMENQEALYELMQSRKL